MDELIQLTPYLDISLCPIDIKGSIPRSNGFDISSDSLIKLQNIDINHDNLGREKIVWFALYEYCMRSIEYNTALILINI